MVRFAAGPPPESDSGGDLLPISKEWGYTR
jgi:hypothetical protein